MKKYTVVAEVYDTEETLIKHVTADDAAAAAAFCEDEARQQAVDEGDDEPGDDDVCDKLIIRAVFEGHHNDQYDEADLFVNRVLSREAREYLPEVKELMRAMGL